ncbi:MAG: acyltransferase [Actinomycetales bacterium]|nr:acyltransferase [Actinomycetales bacterium]
MPNGLSKVKDQSVDTRRNLKVHKYHKDKLVRKDIQGLRAWAVFLVVVFHADLLPLSGGFIGVDIFFVLSGFLITNALILEIQKAGRINLISFWARRARRLLPASTVVLLGTLICSLLVLPLFDQQAVTKDIFWATLFTANWHFAAVQTDYWNVQSAMSPVLHYWSLGVEEQFYFVWPVLLMLLAYVTNIAGKPIMGRFIMRAAKVRNSPAQIDLRVNLLVGAVCVAVICISFKLNLETTFTNQPFAYFGSHTRAWQLAAGGLLAATLKFHQKLADRAKLTLFLLGFIVVLFCAATFRQGGVQASLYPGSLAVLPTIGAGLVIIGGNLTSQTKLLRITNNSVAQKVGDISYSLYLIHWPVLVLGQAVLGSTDLLANLGLVTFATLLAWLLTRYIENPIRFSNLFVANNVRCLKSAGASLATLLLIGLFASIQVKSASSATAQVLTSSQEVIRLRPTPAMADQDFTSLAKFGCSLSFTQTKVGNCLFGDKTANRKVVLLGDSHASAIFPILEKVAKQNHVQLYVWEKNSCPFSDITKFDRARSRPFWECDQFRGALIRRTLKLKPDLVIIAQAYNPDTRVINRQTHEVADGTTSSRLLADGIVRSVSSLAAQQIPLLYLHEPPYAPFNPAQCLMSKRKVSACIFKPPALAPEFLALKTVSGVKVVDLYSAVCNKLECNPVQGDILVYRDRTHMTKTYVLSLFNQFNLVFKELLRSSN